MKKLTKFLVLSSLILLGTGQMWAWNIKKNCVYLDNSNIKWDYPSLHVYQGDGGVGDKYYSLTSAGNDYYYYGSDWDNLSGFELKNWASGDKDGTKYTDWYTKSCESPVAITWTGSKWEWKAVGVKDVKLSDNGSTTYGGNGTSSTPYIIWPGEDIKAKMSCTKIADTNHTRQYKFGSNSFSTTDTYQKTTSTTSGTLYEIYGTARAVLSNNTSTTSREFSATSLYYQTATFYLIKSDGTNKGTKVGSMTRDGSGNYTYDWTCSTPGTYYFYVSTNQSSGNGYDFLGTNTFENGTAKECWHYNTSNYEHVAKLVATYAGTYTFTFYKSNDKYYFKCDYPAAYSSLSAVRTPEAAADAPQISNTIVAQGSSVTVTAKTAATGYRFVNWTSSNGSFGNNEQMSTTFTPNANNAVATANYSLINYTITYDPEPPVNFAYTTAPTSKTYGQSVAMEFTPAQNYVIASVTAYKTGTPATTVTVTKTDDTHYSFTQPAYDVTVQVEVSLSTVKVTYGEIGNGSIIGKIDDDQIGDSPADVSGGSTVVFTATPDANYTVEGWYNNEGCTGDKLQQGDNTGNPQTYTIPNIAEARMVYVKFKERDYSITLSTGTGISAIKVDGTAQQSVTAHVTTKTATITADVADGYTWKEWTVSTNNITASPDLATNGIQINATADGTLTATATVTATYDQPMPALSNFTAPVKNGYKFLGYYYGDTKYYNADGSSARTWDIDNNVTLTAKWDQIHVYIEGRFKVRTSEEGEWKYVAANGAWTDNSTNIEFDFDAESNKYILHTYAYFDELAEQINNQVPYFHLASYCNSENIFHQFGATSPNYEFTKAIKSGPTKADGDNFVFGSDCHDSSVDLIYDPVGHTLSYESVAEQHYNVTFIEGGQGTVNTPGTQSVGVRGGWNITATPKDAYRFDHWSTTGGAHVADASSSTTAVTVTGDGTVTANFVFDRTRVYFQMPQDWIDAEFTTVYVYFYKGDYWDDTNGSGAGGINQKSGTATSGNCIHYGKMTHTGVGSVYYYDVPYLENLKSFITFTNNEQPGYDKFSGTSVACSWTLDNTFSSAKMMYVPDNYITKTVYFDKIKTDYYNNGSWQFYSNSPEEYYVQHDHTTPVWTTLSELRFEPTENNNIRKTILRDLTANEEYKFKIWKSTGASFGCNTTITGNVDNYKFYLNNPDCTLKPKYVGNYELTLNVSDMQLSVRYLADFYIRSFPEAISVVPNGIKRIEPKIDLRDGYDVEKLTVTISNTDNEVATVEQSGYNIIVTGKQNGTTTATITYNYNGNVFAYNLTIVVGPAVTIQAKIEEGDTKWIYTNMVNVHYWLDEKTADVNMTYTESGTDKYYTASIPLPEDETTFNMMFWYSENIDMSSSEVWRKTGDIDDLAIYTDGTKTQTQSYCFTIKHTAGNDKQRTETHVEGLCIEGDAIYQVEVTMKNGKMYTSNVVSTNGEMVSFFAPNTSALDYTKGTIRLMKNGAEIMQTIENATPGIYTATLNIPAIGNASLSDITLYTGDFYVLSGLSSTKKDDASRMTEFTRQQGEAFSYYWVAYSNDCPSKNANATLANAYNDNLSIAIGSDEKTDSEGNVESGNVRFSYEPTTNEFKRAVIGGSTENPKFLALVGNNVYDTDGTTALDDAQYALEDTKCKFTDASDWVYEKNIKIMANGENDANVYIKAQFNGVLTELLGYEIDSETGEETTTPKPLTVMGKSTTPGTYDIRIIYDYKKNRLLSAWEPQEQTISTDMTIESDVMFISQEDGDVKQVTIGDVTEGTPAKLTSLQNVMYVKEFLQSGNQKTYWMSLPFDCRISDIYGIGGYGTVWRIQEYDGKTRAQNGWLNESQTFWRTMEMNEEMKAGYGYLLQIVRTKMEFHEIDGKAALRLYFPSKEVGFTMTRSAEGETKEYDVENCTIKGREAEDSNWKLMGPMAYNNIKIEEAAWDGSASQPTENNFPSFIYEYDAANKTYNVVSAENRTYHSFHAFMTQFGGTIEWQPYTETKPGQAPRFADLSDSFKGGRLSIELVQSEETLDRTFVTLSQYGTEGFDQNKDLTKIAESRSTISTITNDVEYAGNTLPLDIEMVPLNVKVVANGTYDIALEQSLEGLEVRLYDAFEQTTTPLDLMSATVTLDKGEYKDRFFLQLKQKGGETPTSFDGKLEQFNLPTDKTQKLLINDNIYLINAGRIYNVLGARP